MSRREKKLLICTLMIVLLGGVVWLMGRSDEAGAAAPDSTPVEVANSGDSPPPAPTTAGETTPVVRAHRYLEHEVEKVLQAFEETHPALARDPFRGLPTPTGVAEVDSGQALPEVGGVFISRACRGALLDGQVRFLGEHHGPFTLVAVEPTKVLLERNGQTISLAYEP